MVRPKYKAVGERGSWFAVVDGERLPCVHRHWVSGIHHCDPNVGDDPKWTELISAIKLQRKVVLTDDHVSANETAFERKGYIAIFSIDNFALNDGKLEFDLKERIAELG